MVLVIPSSMFDGIVSYTVGQGLCITVIIGSEAGGDANPWQSEVLARTRASIRLRATVLEVPTAPIGSLTTQEEVYERRALSHRDHSVGLTTRLKSNKWSAAVSRDFNLSCAREETSCLQGRENISKQ